MARYGQNVRRKCHSRSYTVVHFNSKHFFYFPYWDEEGRIVKTRCSLRRCNIIRNILLWYFKESRFPSDWYPSDRFHCTHSNKKECIQVNVCVTLWNSTLSARIPLSMANGVKMHTKSVPMHVSLTVYFALSYLYKKVLIKISANEINPILFVAVALFLIACFNHVEFFV